MKATGLIIFEAGLKRDDYVGKSGGLTQRADGKRTYVVRANGAVVSEAKARWFQSLTPPERLDIFFSLMDLILEINPAVAELKDAEPVPGRVLVLELPRC